MRRAARRWPQGPPDPLVSVALSRRRVVYRRDRQDGALFTFAQLIGVELDSVDLALECPFVGVSELK